MIEGVVDANLEAMISLTGQRPSGQAQSIDAIHRHRIGDFLTLPSRQIIELNPNFGGVGRATLSDGIEVSFPFYNAAVFWDGDLRHGLGRCRRHDTADRNTAA